MSEDKLETEEPSAGFDIADNSSPDMTAAPAQEAPADSNALAESTAPPTEAPSEPQSEVSQAMPQEEEEKPQEPERSLHDVAPGVSSSSFISQLTNPTAQQLDQQNLLLAQDLASKAIHPKTMSDLYAEKSTLGKVGTIFGLMLSGAGSGLAHQQNAALDMMNKEIERDFQAQQASKTGANSFLSTAYQHELNLAHQKLLQAQTAQVPLTNQQITANIHNIQSDAMLKAQTSTLNAMKINMMQHLEDVSSKLPPAQQQSAMNTLNTQIKPAVIQSIQSANARTADQLAARAALRNQQQDENNNQRSMSILDPDQVNAQFQANQQRLRLLDMNDLANDRYQRFIPNVGMASVPVTEQDRSKILAAKNFGSQLQKYKDFVSGLSEEDRLNPAKINAGKVLATELRSTFAQATNSGVFDPSEQKATSAIIPDPTNFVPNLRVLPQIEQVEADNQRRYSNLLESKGFPSQAVKAKPKVNGKPNSTPQLVEGQTGTVNGTKVVVKNGKLVPYSSSTLAGGD